MEQLTGCSKCGREIAGGELLYTKDADAVCPQCLAEIELLDLDRRAGQNIVKAAWSCLALAVTSLFVNMFLAATILSISSGLYAIKSLSPDNERFARHIAGQRVLVMVLSCLGIVLTLAGLSLQLLGWSLRVL